MPSKINVEKLQEDIVKLINKYTKRDKLEPLSLVDNSDIKSDSGFFLLFLKKEHKEGGIPSYLTFGMDMKIIDIAIMFEAVLHNLSATPMTKDIPRV